MLTVLNNMRERKIISSINAVDLNMVNEISIPGDFFDIIIIIANPFSIGNLIQQTKLKDILKKGKQVYYHMVWETDPMPSYWEWLWKSDVFTGFIAPSKFVHRLISSKTNKPVFYIPHFVDTTKFSKIDLNKKAKEKVFTVLSVGQWTKRKGNEDAVIAFSRALGTQSDCRLVVKYTEMKDVKIDIEGIIKFLIQTNCVQLQSPILATEKNLPQEELSELYKMSSVLLYPSRGEGFGLILSEIMSTGIPIIYTNWSSTAEVAAGQGNVPVKYFLDEAVGMSQFGYEKGLRYAIPCMTDLIMALERKYVLWKTDKRMYYEETIDNYKIVDERYGLQAVTQQFIEFLEKTNDNN